MNKKDLKEHMKLHSYKKANYQCIDCNYIGDSQSTMDIHIGKRHSKQFECGLCESEFRTLDELELHLFTCETYCCNKDTCDEFTLKTLEEMKTHIRETHERAAFSVRL